VKKAEGAEKAKAFTADEADKGHFDGLI